MKRPPGFFSWRGTVRRRNFPPMNPQLSDAEHAMRGPGSVTGNSASWLAGAIRPAASAVKI
jgi:hypothetical protein